MERRIVLALLGLLISLLLGCNLGGEMEVEEEIDCGKLWADCPGILDDHTIAESATDLREEVSGDRLYYSYYNCATGQRTPTLNIDAACDLILEEGEVNGGKIKSIVGKGFNSSWP